MLHKQWPRTLILMLSFFIFWIITVPLLDWLIASLLTDNDSPAGMYIHTFIVTAWQYATLSIAVILAVKGFQRKVPGSIGWGVCIGATGALLATLLFLLGNNLILFPIADAGISIYSDYFGLISNWMLVAVHVLSGLSMGLMIAALLASKRKPARLWLVPNGLILGLLCALGGFVWNFTSIANGIWLPSLGSIIAISPIFTYYLADVFGVFIFLALPLILYTAWIKRNPKNV